MTYLVLSDIHANMPALESVLASAEGQYDEVINCGDVVGYGPDPQAAAQWALNAGGAVIRGNHDRVCACDDPANEFNPKARAAVEWTRSALSGESRAYLRALPEGPVSHGGAQFCHGSPEDEDEYLSNAGEASRQLHTMQARLTFFGHTHRQGGWVARRRMDIPEPHREPSKGQLHTLEVGYASVFQFRPLQRDETEAEVKLDDQYVYLLNPGSVGQPRDGDARAAYCLYTPESKLVRFRRTAYDVATTQRRIREAGLPDWLAERLESGF